MSVFTIGGGGGGGAVQPCLHNGSGFLARVTLSAAAENCLVLSPAVLGQGAPLYQPC